jgi:hypothetical protein
MVLQALYVNKGGKKKIPYLSEIKKIIFLLKKRLSYQLGKRFLHVIPDFMSKQNVCINWIRILILTSNNRKKEGC